jgi:hypothetical protein
MTDNILTSDNMDNEHIGLTEMDRKVILNLADKGPHSGYDFHLGGIRERGSRTAMMSSGTWHELKEKLGSEGMNLIQLIKSSGRPKKGMSRSKDLYWLTPAGIKVSLAEGASPKLLRNYMEDYLPKSEETESLNCILDLFHVAVMKKFITRVFRREINEGDMMFESLSYLADFYLVKEFDVESKKRTVDILRKYPQVFQSFKTAVKEGKKKMDELDKELNL